MDVCTARDIHEAPTRLSGLTYCFTPKHHGGDRSASRWLPDLSRPEEFEVFDMADFHQLSDDDGNLYGVRIVESGGVRRLSELGTEHELVARFWAERQADAHWHGHPLWPILTEQASNGGKQRCHPPKEVFDRMVEARIGLSVAQARRLKTGKHATLGGPGQ